MNKKNSRLRRAARARYTMKRLGAIRLVVHRTSRHIYAQIISSDGSKVITSASTLERSLISKLKNTGNKYAAHVIGTIIANRALHKGINNISFDRSGFKYHGRIQALADAARIAGLQF